ncbi:MAG: flagellar motor protein MotA, partial [Burkholderiales bacterium PBB5]
MTMRQPSRIKRRLQTLKVTLLVVAGLLGAAGPACAWWNEDWSQRTRYALDTTDKGQPIGEALTGVPLAIRLHSGNFDFLSAKADGSDLRVLAADDKTVLPHRLERFDATNELAVVWVVLPNLAPGSDKNLVYVYAGNDKSAAVAAATGVGDAAVKLAVGFSDVGAKGLDAVAALQAKVAVTPEPNALLAGGAKLTGAPMAWAADSLKIAAGAPATLSLWVKTEAGAAGTLLAWGPVSVSLAADGKLSAKVGTSALAGGSVTAATWTHVALVLEGAQARLHVNGAEVAKGPAATPELSGELRVGADLRGA